MRIVVLLLLASFLVASVPSADGKGIRAKVDELEMALDRIRKAWEKAKVDKLVKMLPVKGKKVKLQLRGVKLGDYRKEQAHALLKKYFGAIETISFKIKPRRDSSTRAFTHVYRVRANRKKEPHKGRITLDREEGRWVIVEILEY